MQLKNFFILLCVVHFSFGAKALVTEWESNLPENSQFNVSKTMKARVDFWKRIYAEVSESEGLLHDVDDPGIVYSKIDLSNIKKSKHMNASQKAKSISKLIDDERLRIAKKHKIKNIKTIRLQMGLKERMQKALFVSGKYLPMMEDVFEKKGLPLELTRLVFVESSFNIRAQSKVGASGLWQIMPFVAKPEGYIKEYYDKRNHPYYATLLAADILATNHKSLKRWPLAITAYNHGLTGVRRMAAMNETEDISKLIQTNKKTRTWGFASSNFYACFLAVLEVEREAQSLFGKNLIKSKPMVMNRVVTKTTVTKTTVLKHFNGSMHNFKRYNPHLNISLLNKTNRLPAGIPLVLPKKTDSAYFKSHTFEN